MGEEEEGEEGGRKECESFIQSVQPEDRQNNNQNEKKKKKKNRRRRRRISKHIKIKQTYKQTN